MKNPELYQKTVDILVQAYLEDELEHEDCFYCAVGNIIARSCGYKIVDVGIDSFWTDGVTVYNPSTWTNVFCTSRTIEQTVITRKHWFKKDTTTVTQTESVSSSFEPEKITDTLISWAKATGYSIADLANIERVFEMAPKGQGGDEWMFNGLMAVIDQLDEIHENTDANITESAKQRFVKQAA